MYELEDILAEEGKSRYFVPAIKNKLTELHLNYSIVYALKSIRYRRFRLKQGID